MIKSILNANKWWIKPLLIKLQIMCIKSAVKEQGLEELSHKLTKIVPDLTEQYTTFKVDNEYLRWKVRAQHAFQIKMVFRAIEIFSFSSQDVLKIVDIGDSSGTHLSYIRELFSNYDLFSAKKTNLMSVNLDPIAVDKILLKGFDAKLCRAEELYERYNIRADLLISFQMIEHLYDPISFLDSISKNKVSDYFVITVPYLNQSRIGLHHIRQNRIKNVFPENTHIFELSPFDWKLIFQHSGWVVVDEMTYRQYPLKSFWIFMKPVWKKIDFEGFYGIILKRNRKWADLYKSNDIDKRHIV